MSVTALSADRLCSLGHDLLNRGQAAPALQTLLRALQEDRACLPAHEALLRIIRMTVDAEIDHLGRLWASAISPGFGVEAAEEFLMETFPRHPDRYETFLGAANFAMRRGEGEVAEALLSYCLASSEEADEASFREISSKYDVMANGYDEEALHKDAVGDFANFVLSHVALATGRDVIDVACGTGLLADAIRPPPATQHCRGV